MARSREGAAGLRHHPRQLTDRFYEIFFERYPEARALFDETRMPTQAVMLSSALMVAKQSPDSPLGTQQYLRVLGTRHARKDVPRELYPAFIEILLEALEEFHGKDWSATPRYEALPGGHRGGADRCDARDVGITMRFV